MVKEVELKCTTSPLGALLSLEAEAAVLFFDGWRRGLLDDTASA